MANIVTGREVMRIIDDELIERGYPTVDYKYPRGAIRAYLIRNCRITKIGRDAVFAGIGIRTTIDYWFRTYFKEENYEG